MPFLEQFMSKPDALTALTQHNANKIASLSPEQFAIFQTLEAERAAKEGRDITEALAFIDVLKTMGNANTVGSSTPATDKTVENREQEKRITEAMAANGKTPEEINQDLAAMKFAGELMAGGGVMQTQGNTITPSHTPNVAIEPEGPGRG
jgi:hypothetical protein